MGSTGAAAAPALSEATRDDFLSRYGERFRARSMVLPHGLLPVSMAFLVDGGVSTAAALASATSLAAAACGLGDRKGRLRAGYDADLLILDPRRSSTIANADQVSRAGYTPFDGWTVRARLTNVFLRGREIARGERLVAPAQGKIVQRES